MRGGGIRRETTEPGEGGGGADRSANLGNITAGSAGQHRLTQHARLTRSSIGGDSQLPDVISRIGLVAVHRPGGPGRKNGF